MILPEGIKNFNNDRKFRKLSEKLNDVETRMVELKGIINSQSTTTEKATTTSTTMTPKALISKRVNDVEYDDDFEGEYEDRFNEIPTMALHKNEPKYKYEHPEIREFAIDVWNGSPGLKYWGYNESQHYE
jgi:hypothetical protein